jgi:glycosyltransferase involved in cell wall biosynthesis
MISIVIPVYNERDNVAVLHEEIQRACDTIEGGYEIVWVDDGSDDGTAEALERIALKDARSRIVALKRNFGQTAALSAGFDSVRGDIVATLDGDLQNDPADIPRLIAACRNGRDCVCGWRKKRKDALLTKTIPSRIANRIICWLTGLTIHDSGCTLKAFRRRALENLRLYGEMHRFIPALLHWNGAAISEIIVNHRPRRNGTSKYRLSKLWRVVLDILTIRFFLHYATRPIHLFGKFALACFGLSAVAFAALVFMKLAWGVDMTGNPFMTLTVFLGFMGVQLLSIGFLGEIDIRSYYEGTGRKTYAIDYQKSTPEHEIGRADNRRAGAL